MAAYTALLTHPAAWDPRKQKARQPFDFIDTGLHQIIAGDLAPIDQLQGKGLFGGQRTCRAPQPGVVDVETEHAEIAGADDLRAGHGVLPIGPGRRQQQRPQADAATSP